MRARDTTVQETWGRGLVESHDASHLQKELEQLVTRLCPIYRWDVSWSLVQTIGGRLTQPLDQCGLRRKALRLG